MLKIRLQRIGRKNDPAFRLVVTELQNGPRSGRFLEILGSYNPRHGKPQVKVDRVKYWLSVGAQASDTAHNLLVSEKIVSGPKRDVSPSARASREPVEEKPVEKTEKPAEEAKTEETEGEVVAEETVT